MSLLPPGSEQAGNTTLMQEIESFDSPYQQQEGKNIKLDNFLECVNFAFFNFELINYQPTSDKSNLTPKYLQTDSHLIESECIRKLTLVLIFIRTVFATFTESLFVLNHFETERKFPVNCFVLQLKAHMLVSSENRCI